MSEGNRQPISIVVPVYNEEMAIEAFASELSRDFQDCEIIFVDDGCTDRTVSRIKEFENIKIIRHEKNKGFGAALKSGINRATNEIIVTIDADGEFFVRDIRKLVQGLDGFSMVVGKRINETRKPLWKRLGKNILWGSANGVVGFKIPDINSGLRVFKKSVIQKYFDFLSDTYSFHTTSTLVFIFNGYKIQYVPVWVSERIGKSKVTIRSGIISLLKIFKVALAFRMARAILMLTYVLVMIFFISSFFLAVSGAGASFLWVCVLLVLATFFAGIFFKCNKDIIVDIPHE